VERYELYSDHVVDVLHRLQRVLTGDLGDVTIPDYIQRGIVEPARDVMQGPHEDIRISVLLPEGDRWHMAWSAGHSLDGQSHYNERIVDTLSRDPYESGESEYWPDVTADERFRVNPRSTRPFHSMLSEPIRNGGVVVGVLNVVSSIVDAFDPAEQRYVASLGSVIGVAVSVYVAQEEAGSE
jgi:GAF domain-containing protein